MPAVPHTNSVVSLLKEVTPQTPPKTIHLILLQLVDAIDVSPLSNSVPSDTAECLLPYLAPPGTHYGDPVPVESPDNMHDTKSAGIAITALASLLRRYRSTPYWGNALQRLVGCWPSTLMALLFYARALLRKEPPPPVTDVDSPAYAFTTIITLLKMYADVESLAALVRSTPKATNLICRLWAFEIMNSRLSKQLAEMFPGTCQPTAAGLLNYYLFARRALVEAGAILLQTLQSSLPNLSLIASVALEHLSRSTAAVYRLEDVSAVDQMSTSLRTLDYLHSTALHPHLLSLNSVGIVTGALVALVSRPFDAASADVTAECIADICEYLRKYSAADGLTWLNQALELGLLLALLKASPWLAHSKSAFSKFTALMTIHLPRYLIYISILRQVNKSLNTFARLGSISAALSDSCRRVWQAFEHYARIRVDVATLVELQSLPCNNSECNEQSTMRCSNCYDAVYCSHECQAKYWNSHIKLCQARVTARQAGTPPELGAADIHFALRVVQADFEERKADICRRWTEAGTLPLIAGVDYSVFPPAVSIDAPGIVREQMGSDAAIFVALPQGTSEKVYYMCDLGLTRGAEDTDEETIKVVVQMIGAQPVPAFFPIN
ncbi:hypothetical protein B0H16DRAFT_353230 [Mycena metata]|uniref:MYND-type domain-containing protein n=1 Tax=Mycena metata TaxID=1033252 RepID=A0AAD7JP63_9AGAR|nr:hypothetical protein B0H16DRAFT_353230 [Mycena metata]